MIGMLLVVIVVLMVVVVPPVVSTTSAITIWFVAPIGTSTVTIAITITRPPSWS